MKRLWSFVFFVFAAGLGLARAQEELTLEKAVGLALQRHPAILSAQKEVSAAAGRRMQAAGIADPTLVLHEDGLGVFRQGEAETTIGLEQSLEFPGKRALRIEIGKEGETLAALELERLRTVVAGRVKKAYYAAVLAGRTVESLLKSSVLLDDFIAGLAAKFEAGDGAYSDVLRAKVEKARLQNQILEERRVEAAAVGDLNLEIGRRADEPARLVTDLAYVPMARDLASLKDEARATSPTLKILAAKRRQAGTSLALARKNGLPDFSLGVYSPSKQWGNAGFYIGVSLPIWKTRRAGEVLEAEAATDLATLAENREEFRLAARVARAFDAVKTAEAQVKVFERSLLKDLDDQLRLNVEQYQIGQAGFLDVIDLYRTYVVARLEHLKALHLYLVSLAELEVAGEDITA
jgi:outer membrane protein, heavy metal efflux system